MKKPKGLTKHDVALLRLVAEDHRMQQFVVAKKPLGTVGDSLDRIADVVERLQQTPTIPNYRNPAAEVLDTLFNRRPAPR